MASFSNPSMSASGEDSALQTRRSSALFGALPAFGPALPGTRFETLPPLAISTGLFKFLRCLGLSSVGLSLDLVPFHEGWELVEWKPTLTLSEVIEMEFDQICAEIEEEERVKLGISKLVEICDEIEIEDHCELVGPQIDLDLGEGSSIFDEEPAVEVPDVVPTVVV